MGLESLGCGGSMKYVIEAGTDAASLLLFDPAALPADFERRFQHDAVETLERLAGDGSAFRPAGSKRTATATTCFTPTWMSPCPRNFWPTLLTPT